MAILLKFALQTPTSISSEAMWDSVVYKWLGSQENKSENGDSFICFNLSLKSKKLKYVISPKLEALKDLSAINHFPMLDFNESSSGLDIAAATALFYALQAKSPDPIIDPNSDDEEEIDESAMDDPLYEPL